jgi:hypothetical protein
MLATVPQSPAFGSCRRGDEPRAYRSVPTQQDARLKRRCNSWRLCINAGKQHTEANVGVVRRCAVFLPSFVWRGRR